MKGVVNPIRQVLYRMKMCNIYLKSTIFSLIVIEGLCQIGRFDLLPDGKECPVSSVEWKKLADARNCPDDAPYHCLQNQNKQSGEICVKQSWVDSGQCPLYDTSYKKIDLKPCQPFDGYTCSASQFLSYNVYLHEICLRTPMLRTTTAGPQVEITNTASGGSGSSPVGPIVAAILLILVVVAIAVWFFYLRRRYNLQITVPFTKREITICAKPEESNNEDPESQRLVEDVKHDQVISSTGAVEDGKPLEKKIRRSNPYFVETKIYREIISTLENHNVVLVLGKTGIGKSATCVGVLEYYRDRLEWKTKHLQTETVEKLEEKTIVLVDITFGDIPLYSCYDPNIKTMLNKLYTSTLDCGEFKVLITSSSQSTSEINIPILKECTELNIENTSYDKEDLKDLYVRYTQRNFNIDNETAGKSDSKVQTSESVISNNNDQQNGVIKEQTEVKVDIDISTHHLTQKTNSSRNLSDSLESRQSEADDTDTGSIKQVVDESVGENNQKEESISREVKEQKEKDDDIRALVEEEETEATETSGTTPAENIIGKYHPPIQEIGDVNQSRNDTGTSVSDIAMESQLQTQSTNEGSYKNGNQAEGEDEIWKKANISEFGLPAVCYLNYELPVDVQSDKTADLMSYLDDFVLSLAESNNKWYSTLIYMMLNGSTIWSGSLVKQLMVEIDPSLDPEQLLVCATEMVDKGMLQRRDVEYLYSEAEEIPRRFSACPTKCLEAGRMRVLESVFSFSNDLLLFAVIKSYVTKQIQIFVRYSYLPFIMQFLQPTEQSDSLSIQLGGDSAFLVELGTGCAKRNFEQVSELKGLTLLKEFKTRLTVHEVATSKSYKIDKEKMDEKKGNTFLRKMINHHPYLKEYYEYAEPEKFLSIPKDGFKQEVKDHPSCCHSQKVKDF